MNDPRPMQRLMSDKNQRLLSNKERKDLARALDWFSQEYSQAGRKPRDLLQEAKRQFIDNRYEESIAILQIYLAMPKGLEDNVSAAFHMLGHCYLRLGQADKGQQFFLASIGAGYQPDWQTVVEVECEIANNETSCT